MHRWLYILKLLSSLSLVATSHALASPVAVPNASAFNGWTANRDDDGDPVNIAALPSAAGSLCAGDFLYPAHPQQDLKRYHGGLWGGYDLARLRGGDSVCLTPLRPNAKGISYCARADTANDVVLSDVYTDGCGHLVRGFVEIQFMTRDESMGTLESPGRAVYPNPHSDFAGSMIPGGTFAVERARFMKITPVFRSDIAQTARLRDEALRAGFSFDAKTHVFKAP